MDYKTQKEVLNLRKFLFEEFFEMQKDDEDYLTDDKMVSIDSIIAILSTYDLTIDKVEDEVREKDEMAYYEIDELTQMKDKTISLAKKLKKEIIYKFYGRKYKNEDDNDIAVDLDDGVDFDLRYTIHLRGKIMTISRESNNLKELLEKENFTSETLDELILEIQEMYNKIEEIYGDITNSEELYDEFDNDEELAGEILYDEYDEYEEYLPVDEQWKNTSIFNYDIATIDSIYISLFGEIDYAQKVLISVMLADFYEYHKVNKLFEFKQEEDKDVLDTLGFIETSSQEENIQRFINEPIWADYIIDSYVYYNVNNTPNDKLTNRMAISELGKLDILKTYNPYINDTLKDETLYNLFITPISNLIRTTTFNLTVDLEVTAKKPIDELLIKYFTTNFLPNNDDYIPESIKKAKIKDLKKLQLKFMISDFLKRNIHEDDEFITHLLSLNEEELYNYVKNDKGILRGIIKEYLKEMANDREIELNKEDKQKILRINKLTVLDV